MFVSLNHMVNLYLCTVVVAIGYQDFDHCRLPRDALDSRCQQFFLINLFSICSRNFEFQTI